MTMEADIHQTEPTVLLADWPSSMTGGHAAICQSRGGVERLPGPVVITQVIWSHFKKTRSNN